MLWPKTWSANRMKTHKEISFWKLTAFKLGTPVHNCIGGHDIVLTILLNDAVCVFFHVGATYEVVVLVLGTHVKHTAVEHLLGIEWVLSGGDGEGKHSYIRIKKTQNISQVSANIIEFLFLFFKTINSSGYPRMWYKYYWEKRITCCKQLTNKKGPMV